MPEPDPIAELLADPIFRTILNALPICCEQCRLDPDGAVWHDAELVAAAFRAAPETEWAVVDRGRTIHIDGATCPADVMAGAHGHGATQVGVVRRTVWRTPWAPVELSPTHATENTGSAAPTKEVPRG